MRLCACKIVHKQKESIFITKVKFRFFLLISGRYMVSHVGTQARRLHTKLFKIAWTWGNN